MPNTPVYPIGIVSEFLGVHPETIRVWERHGIVQPLRRSGKRFYSQNDLKRLQFIQRLMAEKLNLPGIKYYLKLYPCWQQNGCPGCIHRSEVPSCGKPCWKEEGIYCQSFGDENACSKCEFHSGLER